MLQLLRCLDKFHKQHIKIAQLVTNLEKISGNCLDFTLINQAIEELVVHTNEHFHDEDVIMVSLNYPRISEHRRQHRVFIDTVQDLCFGPSLNQITDPVEELITFVHAWSKAHINSEDQHLDNFILEQIRQATGARNP